MNEITEEQINTHVTLKVIEVGNYDQQVNLMTAGGTTFCHVQSKKPASYLV